MPSESATRLTDLPNELLLQILEGIDDATLCALGSTCRELNKLVFPYFFEKYTDIITNPSQGHLSCYRAPWHTLRAVRCNLASRNINNIHYYFNRGIERLVEEVEEMHAIARKVFEVTDFMVSLSEPDNWASSPESLHLGPTQVHRITEERWTKLYLRLLTTSLTKGCVNVELSGGDQLLRLLRNWDQRERDDSQTRESSSRERVLDVKAIRYFDGSYPPFDAAQSKRHSQVAQSPEMPLLGDNQAFQPEILEGSSDNHLPVVRERTEKSRFFKPIEFSSRKNKNSPRLGAAGTSYGLKGFKTLGFFPKFSISSTQLAPSIPVPRIRTLLLKSDMLFANPSFLEWTNQLLSWCAPTLKHLELQCPETPSGVWRRFFSQLTLPSLSRLDVTQGLPALSDANIPGTDILGFLDRHPSIQLLTVHRIQVPNCLCALPEAGKRILPNLTEVTAHPLYIQWLLGDKKHCPKLKKVTLSTESYSIHTTTAINWQFTYDAMDRALEALLPRSAKLDFIGFRLTKDHPELVSWLQSHVDAGPEIGILSKFGETTHLQIDAAYHVNILNSPTRLALFAQFVGMLPKIEYLEIVKHPGSLYHTTDYFKPLARALRLHCPQVERVTVNLTGPMCISAVCEIDTSGEH